MPTPEVASVLSLPVNRGLAADIAVRLRAAILAGHVGPGERLGEELLARSMGVSRGPVREALAQLEREGLVVIRRNRGALVARLSREDLEEVYTLRVALERLAIQRAINHATEQHLTELQLLIDRMAASGVAATEQDAAELDVAFHDVLFRAANHRRLYDSWTNLRPQIHILLLSRNVAHPDFRDYAVTGHQAIVDVLRARDETRALAVIETHLRGAYERVVRSRGVDAAGDGLSDGANDEIDEAGTPVAAGDDGRVR